MPVSRRWVLGGLIGICVVGVPGFYYRANYEHTARFHVVTPNRFYRSAQLDADGLRTVLRNYGIKTVINLQHENPDPNLPQGFFQKSIKTPESEVCRECGADYVLLTFDAFPRELGEGKRPTVVDRYLKILDNPTVYPVLIHCAAGLHRTGEMTAIYRMEYEGWSKAAAVRELKANGFGDYACTSADILIYNLIDKYQPGLRFPETTTAVKGDVSP